MLQILMPDLGKYALVVGLSYGIGLSMIAALIGSTWWQSRSIRRKLAEAEARARNQQDAKLEAPHG